MMRQLSLGHVAEALKTLLDLLLGVGVLELPELLLERVVMNSSGDE